MFHYYTNQRNNFVYNVFVAEKKIISKNFQELDMYLVFGRTGQ
jgi:hypothetical protein